MELLSFDASLSLGNFEPDWPDISSPDVANEASQNGRAPDHQGEEKQTLRKWSDADCIADSFGEFYLSVACW